MNNLVDMDDDQLLRLDYVYNFIKTSTKRTWLRWRQLYLIKFVFNHPMGVHISKRSLNLIFFCFNIHHLSTLRLLFHLIIFNIILKIVENSFFIIVVLIIPLLLSHRWSVDGVVIIVDSKFCFSMHVVLRCTPSESTFLTSLWSTLDMTPENRQVLSHHYLQCICWQCCCRHC